MPKVCGKRRQLPLFLGNFSMLQNSYSRGFGDCKSIMVSLPSDFDPSQISDGVPFRGH